MAIGHAATAESFDDRAGTVVLIAAVRWCGVLLGVLQAVLVTDPNPIGGSLSVFAATAVMAAYNVPATLCRRFSPRTVEILRLGCLIGDFAVCTTWTMLVSNDIFSTTYAIYILVGVEVAFLYGMRGAAVFSAGFLLAYAALYWERAHYFGFPVLLSSVIFRSAIVLVSTGFAAAITEQSERRRRAALQASAEARRQADVVQRRTQQLDSLLWAISDIGEGVLSVRGEKIVDANDAYCQLTGYDLAELKALPSVFDLTVPDEQIALEANRSAAGEGAGRETVILAKNGDVIPVEWSTRRLQTDEGELIISVVRDIRERKRILELVEAQRDTASEASRAKSEYLSRMSHELRTPMSAILGFAELLEMQDRVEDRDAIKAILAAGSHLLTLINEVLDISRIEAGKETLSLEPVSVAAVIDECLQLMRPLAQAQRTTLTSKTAAADVAYVEADKQRLIQVMLNLLSNAVKYAGGGSSIVIDAERAGSGTVRLSVTDDGPGIPAELAKRVFDPFDRLGAERTTVAGTGLGLTLAKRLVDSMGGTIGVESPPDGGCSFWVDLTAAVAPPAGAVGTDAALASAGGAHAQEERVVLYVEDNLTTIALMERIFELRPAVKLVTALQGSLAMELAREHSPDLIFLDLHLPDINGDEVLRQLKQDVRTRDIPVFMLSADASERQMERLLAGGAARYLTKPVRVANVLEMIDDLVPRGSERPVQSAAERSPSPVEGAALEMRYPG